MRPPRTVFIGTGPFGVEALTRLAVSPEVGLVGLVTAPPRPSGRGAKLRESPIAEANRHGRSIAPVLTPERLRAPDAVANVLDLQPELIVLADYGQIVPAALLELPLGALNLHPSLLPRHRGASPIPATILGGDAVTGVSLMLMDAGLDTGPIVALERVPLRGSETAPELEELLAIRAADLLDRTLAPWIRGEIEPRPQAPDGATLTRPLRRADGRLDPRAPAAQLERQVRAYQPWPGSWLETDGGRVVVWRARVLPPEAGRAGELVASADGGLALVASGGLLDLVEVQPAGGRRMPTTALVRGRPGLIGSTVHEAPVEPVG